MKKLYYATKDQRKVNSDVEGKGEEIKISSEKNLIERRKVEKIDFFAEMPQNNAK
jgi:hypothetical protein